MSKRKDTFWLWRHPAESHNKEYSIAPSRFTPAQAGEYLGIWGNKH